MMAAMKVHMPINQPRPGTPSPGGCWVSKGDTGSSDANTHTQRHRDTQAQTHGHRHRHRHRQTDRQTDRQVERERERERHREGHPTLVAKRAEDVSTEKCKKKQRKKASTK